MRKHVIVGEMTIKRAHMNIHKFMPARVEYRLGSIFDGECDLLVIPTSSAGTVKGHVRDALREFRIPHPTPMASGTVRLTDYTHTKFRAVAFASAVNHDGSSTAVVKSIGRQLGILAATCGKRISAPIMGTGAGGMTPWASVRALESGFLATAPDDALLVVSALVPQVLASAGRRTERALTRSNEDDLASTAVAPASAETPVAVPAVSPTSAPVRSRVFVSYSHADADWLDRLQKHLRPLERGGAMIWADTRIKAGAQWREEIRVALAETKVAILLISADFMASEFIVTNELPPLLKAAEDEGATILPVIISASSFLRTPSLSRFQAVNNPDKPLVQLRKANREKVLDDVARAVEDALK